MERETDLKDTGEERGEPTWASFGGRTGELVGITNLGQVYDVLAYSVWK